MAEDIKPVGEVTCDAGGRWGLLAQDLPVGAKLYTAAQLAQAVAAEREACAKLCDLALHSAGTTPADCAYAIRARSKESKT